jgi:hypothetical protein
VRAASVYFAIIFCAALVLGVLRAILVAPRTGDLVAVALEVPILLVLAWKTADHLGRGVPTRFAHRAVMGGLALVLLLAAELALGILILQQAPAAVAAGMTTPPGLLGLAGQIAFGMIPLVQMGRTSRR